eukprot:Sdes_comp17396_c0_seq1m6606
MMGFFCLRHLKRTHLIIKKEAKFFQSSSRLAKSSAVKESLPEASAPPLNSDTEPLRWNISLPSDAKHVASESLKASLFGKVSDPEKKSQEFVQSISLRNTNFLVKAFPFICPELVEKLCPSAIMKEDFRHLVSCNW